MREVASYCNSTGLKLIHNFIDSVTRRIQRGIEMEGRLKEILKKWNFNENTIMFKVINIYFSGHWKLKKYWQNIHSQSFLGILYILSSTRYESELLACLPTL